jgi:hypothetical protein
MKKNIIPKIVFGILIIILIVTIAIALTQKEKDMTVKMYKDICEKTNYTFSMTEENLDIDYNLTISKRQDDMSIEAESDNEHTTTLVKDGAAYYVMHLEKEYYLYDSSQIEADIIRSGLAGIEDEKYVTGNEKINGKSYYYEEYEGIPTFIIWSNYDDESSIKTRFYFDKGNIIYIKTIIDDIEELLKIEFTDEVDDSVFEIPNDYAEM